MCQDMPVGSRCRVSPALPLHLPPTGEEGLVNAIGGCCGTSPEHIAAIREMALAYPPRQRHEVPARLRLSGLEPLNYEPDASNMRRTFLNIGERCNVAGSIIYKKAIVDGDYDKAMSIALSQVRVCEGLALLLGWRLLPGVCFACLPWLLVQSCMAVGLRTPLCAACVCLAADTRSRHYIPHPPHQLSHPNHPHRWPPAPMCWTSTWTMG